MKSKETRLRVRATRRKISKFSNRNLIRPLSPRNIFLNVLA